MLVSIFMLRRMSLTQNRDRKSISDLLDQNNFPDRFLYLFPLADGCNFLFQLESVRNFDFELWRQRYLAWVKTKKARITDFFRKQIKNEVSDVYNTSCALAHQS